MKVELRTVIKPFHTFALHQEVRVLFHPRRYDGEFILDGDELIPVPEGSTEPAAYTLDTIMTQKVVKEHAGMVFSCFEELVEVLAPLIGVASPSFSWEHYTKADEACFTKYYHFDYGNEQYVGIQYINGAPTFLFNGRSSSDMHILFISELARQLAADFLKDHVEGEEIECNVVSSPNQLAAFRVF